MIKRKNLNNLAIFLLLEGTIFFSYMIYKNQFLEAAIATLLISLGISILSFDNINHILPKNNMKNSLGVQCNFNRINTKYNRLWNHLITLLTFMGTATVGFVASLLSIDRLSYFNLVDGIFSILFIITALISLVISLILNELLETKNKLNGFLRVLESK